MSRMVKKGRFKHRQVKQKITDEDSNTTPEEEGVEEKIDPILVNAVLESYLSNPERKRALKGLETQLNDKEIGVFIALEAIIRGRGVSK